jgi:hypothetical protein
MCDHNGRGRHAATASARLREEGEALLKGGRTTGEGRSATMNVMTEKRASEADKEYFRRLGQWKAEVNKDRLRLHRALPAQERIRRSERMYRESNGWANRNAKEEEPRSIFDLAKERGVYRP